MMDMMQYRMDEDNHLRVAVMHADEPEKAAELKEQLASTLDCAELYISEITPVLGMHVGPGAVGLAFHNGD